MGAMIKISVIRDFVDAQPGDGVAGFPACANRGQLFTVRLNKIVAIHTCLGWRNVRLMRVFDEIVAIAAVHAQITGVQFVAIIHRLNRAVTNVSEFRRTVKPKKTDRAVEQESAADRSGQGQEIRPLWK